MNVGGRGARAEGGVLLGLKGAGGGETMSATRRKWDFFDHVRSKESHGRHRPHHVHRHRAAAEAGDGIACDGSATLDRRDDISDMIRYICCDRRDDISDIMTRYYYLRR